MRRLTLGLALLFSVALPALADPATPVETLVEAPTITPVELDTRQKVGDAPVIIDVRTAAEFATGHIPGALNIPFNEVAERISDVDAPNGVALYCMMGPRARKGESALLASGYHSVLHIDGGLAAWKSAGLPVEK